MESIASNINDYGRFRFKPNNDNVRNIRKKLVSDSQAEFIADELIRKLNAPDSRLFFLKSAYYLSESKIQQLVQVSLEKGRDPKRLFVYLANKELLINE